MEATPANLAGRDGAALASAQAFHRHEVVADCLASTTTLWLPVYGIGAAVPAGLGVWTFDCARLRRETRLSTR